MSGPVVLIASAEILAPPAEQTAHMPMLQAEAALRQFTAQRRRCDQEREVFSTIQASGRQCMARLEACEQVIDEITRYMSYAAHTPAPALPQSGYDQQTLKQTYEAYHALRDRVTALDQQQVACRMRGARHHDTLHALGARAAAAMGINATQLELIVATVEAPLQSTLQAHGQAVQCPLCADCAYTHVLGCCGKTLCRACTQKLGAAQTDVPPQSRLHVARCPFCRAQGSEAHEIRL